MLKLLTFRLNITDLHRAVGVAQLVERLLPIPEVRGSNPVIGKNLLILNICKLSIVYWKDENKEKEAGNGPGQCFLGYLCIIFKSSIGNVKDVGYYLAMSFKVFLLGQMSSCHLCWSQPHQNIFIRRRLMTFVDLSEKIFPWKNFLQFCFFILVIFLFLKMGQPGLFFIYFRSFQTNNANFYIKCMWKNVHPVYGTGIRTHDLRNMSCHP